MSRLIAAACLLAGAAGPLSAQTWNDDAVTALVRRGIARRAADQASGLVDYRARAHGFVFFLAQLGDEGLAEPPQLVKSDQLELEVYWQAPGASKQWIIGWRDRVDLPTDIQYHRDHLGIVQNGFGDRIRLGEGHEVRDVPHPLSPDGPTLYEYAIVDSLTLAIPGRPVRAVEVAFRPIAFTEPRIVGSMYLDAAGGELVQLRFNFTRSAYLDASLEDITILLEHALWDGRWWLPRRQEIEIRRRTTWLDLPARGIIRGRWEIDGYEFNVGLEAPVFRGPEIAAAPRAARDTFPWPGALDSAIAGAAGPVTTAEMDDVRRRVRDVTGGRLLSGLPTGGFAFGALSDLLHYNRVEGFAPGAGLVLRPGGGGLTARVWSGYGFADERLKARAGVELRTGRATVRLRAAREIRDVADEPSITPLINSILAQERGTDYGDYVLAEEVALGVDVGRGRVEAGVIRTGSVRVRATPATGAFAPNPALGGGTMAVGRLAATHQRRAVSTGWGYRFGLAIEGGAGEGARYGRVRVDGRVAVPLWAGTLRLAGWLGWGSDDLPVYRPFLLGGRTTLVGEPYRAYGGRQAGFVRAEWRFGMPFPAVPLGSFVSTGRQLVVAPFVAVGAAGRPFPAVPWQGSDGPRPVAGVALEVFHRLLRIETGWSPRSGEVGVTIDLRRELWPIL